MQAPLDLISRWVKKVSWLKLRRGPKRASSPVWADGAPIGRGQSLGEGRAVRIPACSEDRAGMAQLMGYGKALMPGLFLFLLTWPQRSGRLVRTVTRNRFCTSG